MSQQSFLLDTNILICALHDSNALAPKTLSLLSDPDNTIYFSSASIWEIAIKSSLKKPNFPFNPERIAALASQTGFLELPIRTTHTFEVAQLPWFHRDPFDRLLIAQALSLPAYLLTTDTTLQQYSDMVRVV